MSTRSVKSLEKLFKDLQIHIEFLEKIKDVVHDTIIKIDKEGVRS